MKVNHRWKPIYAAASVFALLSVTMSSVLAEEIKPSASSQPLETYTSAWKVVKDNFYDPTFNGQDFGRWEHKYDSQIHTDEDAKRAIATMFASLDDRESLYLSGENFSDEKDQIDAHFYGIGIHSAVSNSGLLEVLTPIPRTPAFRAGIQTGDYIVGINHASVPSSIYEAVNLIRGPLGTKVTLTIRRDETQNDVTITRAEIPVYCVFDARMMDKDIGYIRIDDYLTPTSINDIVQNLNKLQGSKGIIIDLRGNCGGLLLTAIDVVTLFLDDGAISTVVDRNGEIKRSYAVEKKRLSQSARNSFRLPLFKQSLVVLTDHSTSRFTEMLVAALKDNRRAVVVGEKTRGRKKESAMFRLPNGGGISLSTFRYLTPLNADLVLGVAPDRLVELTTADKIAGRGPWYSYGRGTKVDAGRSPSDGKDKQLAAACKIMRERLAQATAK